MNTSAKVGAQGEKVMKFVDTAVKGLDDMGGVAKKLDDLGSRHTNYGAKKGHFVVSLIFEIVSTCVLQKLKSLQQFGSCLIV